MNRRATYYGLMVACVLAAADLSAQKYPERRTTRRGTALYGNGDFSGAESQYRRALELNPELREAAFNLGGALWRQAQVTAQAAASGASQGAVPDASGVSGAQGASAAQTEQQQAIQKWAQEATELWASIAADSLASVPMASAASYNAGNVALAGQQLDAAIEAYKGALRLAPDDMEAKFNLAYAQKLKQQQQDQNNDDQNNDDQGGGGGNDQNDRNDDQNNDPNDDGQNDPQDGDGDRSDHGNGDDRDGDGQNDPQNGDGPLPSGEGEGGGEPKMDPRAAEQMLDAMQAAEDDTREKVNAREVQVGSRSGKNW